MPLPTSFKTDESFLEKIAIGATGTQRVLTHLREQGHTPIELERGSTNFKIWKTIKIKRVRVPDILCLDSGLRVESRAKTKLQLSMSHSTSVPERGWDFGLDDQDVIAFVHCERIGSGPLDWVANQLVQYVRVDAMREAWRLGHVRVERAKGAQEGFEVRVTWPVALASAPGIVEGLDDDKIYYHKVDRKRPVSIRLYRSKAKLKLTPLVSQSDRVQPNQIIASVVPVTAVLPPPRSVAAEHYIKLAASPALSDRYTAAKALGHFNDTKSVEVLIHQVQDTREHIYIRAEAAAGLMRRQQPIGQDFLVQALYDAYLANRLEAVIILGEIATPASVQMLISILQHGEQHPEIRAGAAWSLGEIGASAAMPMLLECFDGLSPIIKIEAARALAKIARSYVDDVIQALPAISLEQRPGTAWALSKAGGFTIEQLIPILIDTNAQHREDLRQWIAYIIGTQPREVMVSSIEQLARADPQVYFAVTVLWKMISSWVYGLEEY